MIKSTQAERVGRTVPDPDGASTTPDFRFSGACEDTDCADPTRRHAAGRFAYCNGHRTERLRVAAAVIRRGERQPLGSLPPHRQAAYRRLEMLRDALPDAVSDTHHPHRRCRAGTRPSHR